MFNGDDHQFTTSQAAGDFDVQDVVAHELGHLLGLNHSGWAGSTMFPYVDPSVILHRSLSEDEERGLRDAYPAVSLGRITGTIQRVSPDFKSRETIATGIRFPVAIRFNKAGDLFCTDQEGATWLPNGNPFDELLVIDTTWGMPGSIAGMVLADYGARVVKLERPHEPPVSGAVLRSVVERGKWSVPIDVAGDRSRSTIDELLARADVTNSEKYRRILEAYQIEMDYGRTLEAYEGVIAEAEANKTVQFVRLGRIALMYQTLDGRETGYWNQATRKWVVDDSYAHDVKEALRVAKKQGAPDLLMLPVPAPQPSEVPS